MAVMNTALTKFSPIFTANIIGHTLIDPRNTAIPSGKLCKLMPAKADRKKKKIYPG